MTRAVAMGFLILAVFLGSPAAHAADDPAPDFTAVDVSGLAVSLESFKGQKHVVLVFYWSHG